MPDPHHRTLNPRDIAPLPLPIAWGTPNPGRPTVTGGGLVSIGAAMDDYLRAFDIGTGEELWKGRLPAGGRGRLGTTLGDSLVAFALPAA